MTGIRRNSTYSALTAVGLGLGLLGELALASEVALHCTVATGVDAKRAELVCQEFASILRKSYPGTNFSLDTVGSPAQLEVKIHHATDRGLGLGLVWTSADGKRVDGEMKSVSIMDRDLDAGRRASLYRRVLAATPKPD